MVDAMNILILVVTLPSAVILLMVFLMFPSKRRLKNMYGEASSKQILLGRLRAEFGELSRDGDKHGFEVKIDNETGKVKFIPNSSVSNHSLQKAIET